jgi:cytochrome b561
MTPPGGYSRTQIALHWIVAALIALQFILHDAMSEAWRAVVRGGEAAFDPLVAQHVLGGLLVAALVVWRLVIRVRRGAPPPPEAEHPVLRLAATLAHWSPYALMLLLPVTGAAAWFGGVRAAADGHEVLKTVLLALIALHVGAALFHRFVLKSDVLSRMARPGA